MQRAQAAGANLHPKKLAVLKDGLDMNIGLKPGIGAPLGVADVMATHSTLVTDLASHLLFPVLTLYRYSIIE